MISNGYIIGTCCEIVNKEVVGHGCTMMCHDFDERAVIGYEENDALPFQTDNEAYASSGGLSWLSCIYICGGVWS